MKAPDLGGRFLKWQLMCFLGRSQGPRTYVTKLGQHLGPVLLVSTDAVPIRKDDEAWAGAVNPLVVSQVALKEERATWSEEEK